MLSEKHYKCREKLYNFFLATKARKINHFSIKVNKKLPKTPKYYLNFD